MVRYAPTINPEEEQTRLKQLEKIGQEVFAQLQVRQMGYLQTEPIIAKSQYLLPSRQSGIAFEHSAPNIGTVARLIYDVREHQQYKGPQIIIYGEGAAQGSSIDSAIRDALTNLGYRIIGIGGFVGGAVSYLAKKEESGTLRKNNMKAEFPSRKSVRHGKR